MASQTNVVVIQGKTFSDIETKTWDNGGSVIKFQLGFLESKYYDKEKSKMIYKNGFISVKKNISAKAEGMLERYQRAIVKGIQVSVTGRLGFEEWTGKDGKKVSRIVLAADSIDVVAEEERQYQQSQPNRSSNGYGGGYDAPNPDEGGKDEIPF